MFDNGDYLTFGGDGAVFKEKIYIEMIMKFTNLQNYMSDENIFATLMNFSPSARMGRSMELRYSPAMDAFRFLMTCDTSHTMSKMSPNLLNSLQSGLIYAIMYISSLHTRWFYGKQTEYSQAGN